MHVAMVPMGYVSPLISCLCLLLILGNMQFSFYSNEESLIIKTGLLDCDKNPADQIIPEILNTSLKPEVSITWKIK